MAEIIKNIKKAKFQHWIIIRKYEEKVLDFHEPKLSNDGDYCRKLKRGSFLT